MFGSHTEKIQKLVSKNQWSKIEKYTHSKDPEIRKAVAAACGSSTDDGSFNTLSVLLRDPDAGVQLETVRSLGKMGNEEHASAELRWLLSKTPESNTELTSAIHTALEEMRGRK